MGSLASDQYCLVLRVVDFVLAAFGLILVDFVRLVVCCDVRQWLIAVSVGRFWLILWVWWFVVMFGDAVVVVWYGFLGDSRRFAMRKVVDLGVLLGL